MERYPLQERTHTLTARQHATGAKISAGADTSAATGPAAKAIARTAHGLYVLYVYTLGHYCLCYCCRRYILLAEHGDAMIIKQQKCSEGIVYGRTHLTYAAPPIGPLLLPIDRCTPHSECIGRRDIAKACTAQRSQRSRSSRELVVGRITPRRQSYRRAESLHVGTFAAHRE